MPPYNITQMAPLIKRIHFKIDFHSPHFPMYTFFLFYHEIWTPQEIKEATEKNSMYLSHF